MTRNEAEDYNGKNARPVPLVFSGTSEGGRRVHPGRSRGFLPQEPSRKALTVTAGASYNPVSIPRAVLGMNSSCREGVTDGGPDLPWPGSG